MASSVTSSLTCSVCFNVFEEPKLLECGHTFCLKCIEIIQKGSVVTCPLCRRTTNVDEGDVGKLRTSLIASSIIDGWRAELDISCTASRKGEHDFAAFYCYSCKVFLCLQCEKKHQSWEPNRRHKVTTACEYNKKYNYLKREQKEKDNDVENIPSEKQVCVQCNKFVFDLIEKNAHASKQHEIMSESSFTTNTKKNAMNIKQAVTDTVQKIQSNRTLYCELESIVREHSYDMIKTINATYDEGLRKLDTWKLVQTKQCQILQELVTKSYEYRDEIMTGCVHQLLRGGRLLTTSLANPDNVTASSTLCDDLSRTLKTTNEKIRDLKLEKDIALVVNSSPASNSITTGTIKVNKWDISIKPLVENNGMTSIAVNVDSQIAVSYFEGGVWIFDKSGNWSPLCLTESINALGVAFFSDGKVVVRDKQNQIKLFKSNMKPVPITFNTLSYKKGVQGGLAVDQLDNVYVSYREAKIIQMFTRRGGEAIREIACGIYTPQQIAAISERQLLVMDGEVISVLDVSGVRMHDIKYTGCHGYPAVSSDGSVLIAWVDRRLGILRIDKYTSELKLTKCVYSSNMIQLKGRGWYYLRELPDGGLAFCTSSHLVILKPQICDHVQDVTTYFKDNSHPFSAMV